jgi:hypothetical protein
MQRGRIFPALIGDEGRTPHVPTWWEEEAADAEYPIARESREALATIGRRALDQSKKVRGDGGAKRDAHVKRIGSSE